MKVVTEILGVHLVGEERALDLRGPGVHIEPGALQQLADDVGTLMRILLDNYKRKDLDLGQDDWDTLWAIRDRWTTAEPPAPR